MADLELLSVVALMRDMPEAGLVRGQVGTVVEVLGPEAFEVEFSDDSGRTYASLAPCSASRRSICAGRWKTWWTATS